MLSLREDLAAFVHQAWSGWMRHLFSQGTFSPGGSWTMPPGAVERWTRQMNTPYAMLIESEKDSDRKEADDILVVVRSHPGQ